MANENTRDVALRLAVKTQGGEAVSQLGKEIRELGKQAGDAAPEFVRMANEVEKIGDQLQAVDTLGALTTEVKQLTEAQTAASTKTTELGEALGKLRSETEVAEKAEKDAKETLQATQRTLTEKRIELDKLKNSYDQAGKKTAEYQDAARKLKDEILAARSAILEQRQAFDLAKGAADKAEEAEKTLAKQYGEATKASTAATKAVQDRSEVLDRSRDALEAQGVATGDLAAAQTTLVNAIVRTSNEAEILAIRLQQVAHAEQEAAAAASLQAQTDAAERRLKEIQYAELLEEATRRLTAVREAEEKSIRDTNAAIEAETKSLQAFEQANEAARQSVLRSQYAQVFDELEVSIRQAEQAQREFLQAQKEATAATEAEARAQREFQEAFDEARRSVERSSYAKLFDELDQIDEKNKQAAASIKKLGETINSLDAAFATLGIRNKAAIEADIAAINNALDNLARNARVSGDEFDRAFAAGQGQIKKLQDELNGVTPPAERGSAALRFFSSSLGQLTAAFGVYEAGAFVVKAVNDLESLRRTLVIVTGGSEAAAQRIEFLRNVASESGVAVGDLSREYGRFAASMNAAGISAGTTNRVFQDITKAVGLMGLSSADAEGALRALAQMSSKGKVSMEELSQQLGERLPAVLATTAKGLGVTTADLTKLIENGKILADEEFFSAFAAGVEKNFGTAENKVTGLRAEWSRLMNAFTEGTQIISESAIGKAIGLALAGGAETLKYLVYLTTMIGETFTVTGQTIGTVIAALVTRDFKNLGAALEEIQTKSDDKMTRLVARLQGIKVAADEAGGGATKAGEAMQQAAGGAEANAVAQQQAALGAQANAGAQRQAAVSAQANAAAQTSAGTAAAQSGQQQAQAAQSLVALRNAYDKGAETIEKQIQTAEKLVKAKQLEGQVTMASAKLSGDEVVQRNAAVQAAQGELSAMTGRLSLQQSLIDTRNAEIAVLKDFVARNGDANGARQKEITALELERDKLAATAAERTNEIEQQRTLVREREIAAEAARNNAGRLDELRSASANAQIALQQITLLYQQGLVPQQVYTEATRSAAAATALYRDALGDVVRNLQLKQQAVQVDSQITQARIAAEQLNYQTLAKVAELEGNVAAATEFSVAAKRKQIDATTAARDAKVAETNAQIALLQAQRDDITGMDDVSVAKRQEIDLRIKAQQAKLIEAQSSDSVVRGLNAEIGALQRRNAAAAVVIENRGGANDGLPVGATDNGDGTYNDAFGNKVNKTTGQVVGKAPSTNPFSGAQPDYTVRNDLVTKYRAGTLTTDDADLAIANLNAAKANAAAVKGVAGAKGFTEQVTMAQAIVDAIKNKAVSKTVNVNVKLGNTTSTVNTSSQEDADALVALLKKLEQASGRS